MTKTLNPFILWKHVVLKKSIQKWLKLGGPRIGRPAIESRGESPRVINKVFERKRAISAMTTVCWSAKKKILILNIKLNLFWVHEIHSMMIVVYKSSKNSLHPNAFIHFSTEWRHFVGKLIWSTYFRFRLFVLLYTTDNTYFILFIRKGQCHFLISSTSNKLW